MWLEESHNRRGVITAFAIFTLAYFCLIPVFCLEDNTDRPGGDYRHFDLSTANPSLCEQACAGDPNCQAFTYVRPGYQGANPQCWLKNTVPVSTSNSCCVSGVKAISPGGPSGTMEDNTDRPGCDYRHFDLSTADPSLCEQACAGDPNCQAFTYVRPGYQGANPQCWLKNSEPVSKPDNCCISGVKTGSPGGSSSGGSTSGTSSAMEDNTDRPGGDYRHFDLSTANPSLCEQACAGDPNCQAFTYVRPGVQGANPQCWLKNTVPVSTSNSCCVSGVKAISSGGTTGTMEDNTDRPGGDYRHFDLSTANPSLCEQACAGDPDCQAFTYVRPGVQGANPQCWLKNTVPVSTPNSGCISGVKTVSSGGSSSGGSTSGTSSAMEDNTDRPGGDYRHFDLSTANPSLCEQACAGDPNCQAFTYVRPGVQGANPQCWLKNTVPVSTPNSGCISGVKAVASGTTGTMEDNTDRPGGDYRHFDLSTANPSLCQQACAGDSNCQAFTYVRPGVQGANPQCWLKNTVPVSTSDSCCISGVKT